MRLAAGTAVLVALGATAAPASAADVHISGFAFSPQSVTIDMGGTVTWHYDGPDTNHSVTSDPGQADSWDSDPGRSPTTADHPPGTTYERKFDVPGTFTYFCKVHPSMKARVVVNGPGGSPPPPPADTTAPTISDLKAKGGRKGKPTVVRFDLSEDAQVRIEVPKRPKASKTITGHAGSNAVKFSARKLPPGRYRLDLTATDAAGNASPTAHVKVRVRRR